MSTNPIFGGLRFGVRYPVATQSQAIFAAFIQKVDALEYRDYLSAAEGIAFEVVDLQITNR